MDHLATTRDLLAFIGSSPSMFHTAATIRRELDAAGFTYLPEHRPWTMEPGGSYYTVRNGSSVVALKVGSSLDSYHFQMVAAHGDSPSFKVKAAPELSGPEGYLRLNVEPYGGMIDYTWLDRPLSVAGRVMVEQDGHVESRLLYPNRDVALTRMSNACVFEFTQSDFGGTVCTYMSGALKYRRNALSAEAGGVTAKLAYTAKSRVPAGADLSLREIRADSDDYALCLARVDVEAGETVRFFEVGVTLNGMRVDLEGSTTLTVACAQEAATARAVTLADGHTSDARLTHRKNGRVEARFTADTLGIVAVIYGK